MTHSSSNKLTSRSRHSVLCLVHPSFLLQSCGHSILALFPVCFLHSYSRLLRPLIRCLGRCSAPKIKCSVTPYDHNAKSTSFRVPEMKSDSPNAVSVHPWVWHLKINKK